MTPPDDGLTQYVIVRVSPRLQTQRQLALQCMNSALTWLQADGILGHTLYTQMYRLQSPYTVIYQCASPSRHRQGR